MRSAVHSRKFNAKSIAEAYIDDEETQRRIKATIGSNKLRDATLRALGIAVAEPQPDPVPQLPVFKRQVRKGPGRPLRSRKVRKINGSIIRIMELTASHFRVTTDRLISPDKRWKAVEPRQVAIYLARQRTDASYPDIAFHFGGRDHTTIIYSERAVEKRIAEVDRRTLVALHEINAKLTRRGR
jgi:hypothetical protein